jgi:hypothetical protein
MCSGMRSLWVDWLAVRRANRIPYAMIGRAARVRPRTYRRARRGFTLIEAALTTVIISTGVLAILAAQQAYHRKNNWAQRTGTAILLANELRELTLTMPMHDPITGDANMGPEFGETTVADFNDLDDFAGSVTNGRGTGTVFRPPINALREVIAGMDNWSQHIHVENVLPDNIGVEPSLAMPLGSTDMMRLRVVIRYHDDEEDEGTIITELTWVVGR